MNIFKNCHPVSRISRVQYPSSRGSKARNFFSQNSHHLKNFIGNVLGPGILLLSVFLCFGGGFSHAEDMDFTNTTVHSRSVIADVMAEHGIPGCSAVLVEGRRVTRAEGFGYANVEEHIPVTTDTVTATASPACAETELPAEGLSLIGALEIALVRQPGIQMEWESVRAGEGRLSEERGVFDTLFSLSGGFDRLDRPLPAGAPANHQVTETTELEMAVQKRLRSGMSLRPGVSLNRTWDPLSHDEIQNYATVHLTLVVPLLRGRGREAVSGQETAARDSHAAALPQYRHEISTRVLETASAYWPYAAATDQLRALQLSEDRADEYVRIVRILIEGDERPGSDLHMVLAHHETKTAHRLAGEQSQLEARQALGLAMGLAAEEIDRLPPPSDTLPDIQIEQEALPPTENWVAVALENRNDYTAARLLVESAHALRTVERNNRLPTLDLELRGGYSGLEEGGRMRDFYSAPGSSVPGPSASVTLTYQWPVRNRSARGRWTQADAEYRRGRIAKNDLARRIGSAVALAMSDVRAAASESVRLNRSHELYKRALADEWTRVRMGDATFLSVSELDDRTLDAKRNVIQARLRHAVALARLRYETGLLMVGEDDDLSIRFTDLTTFPFETNERKTP